MIIIGHRGAKGHLAENTIASFEKALQLGAKGVEFDVHLCASGEVVVIHDDTIDRTTSGTGKVSELSLYDLKNVTIDLEYQIPTLEEVLLALHNKCLVNIEIKSSDATLQTLSLVEYFVANHQWDFKNFIISSFDWESLVLIKERNPMIPLGVLTYTDLEIAVDFAKYYKTHSLHPYFHLLDEKNIIDLKKEKFKVFPWTVNHQTDIDQIKKLNVDGIITDFPERV